MGRDTKEVASAGPTEGNEEGEEGFCAVSYSEFTSESQTTLWGL